MASDTSFIVAAFQEVVRHAYFRGKWVTAAEFARVIACEYSLPDKKRTGFDAALLFKSLKKSYPNAGEADGHYDDGGFFTLFRKHYRPNGQPTAHCFFVTQPGKQYLGLPVPADQQAWYDGIVPLTSIANDNPSSHKCRIKRFEQKTFLQQIENFYSSKKSKAKPKANEQQHQPPPDYVTPRNPAMPARSNVVVSNATVSSSPIQPHPVKRQDRRPTPKNLPFSPASKAAITLRPKLGKHVVMKRKAGESSLWEPPSPEQQ